MAGIPDVPYRCPRCGGARTFSTLAELKSHMAEEHAYNVQRRRRLKIFDYSPTQQMTPQHSGRHSPLLQTFLEENQRLEDELRAAKQEELNNQRMRQKAALSRAHHSPARTPPHTLPGQAAKTRTHPPKPKVNFRTPVLTQEPDTYLQESLSNLNHDMLVQRHQHWRTADALYSTQDVLSGVEEAAEDRVSEQKNFISDLTRQLAEKEQQLLALRTELEKVRASEKEKDQRETEDRNRQSSESQSRERQSMEDELQRKKAELENLNKQLAAAKQTDNRAKDAVPSRRKPEPLTEKNRQRREAGRNHREAKENNAADDVSSPNSEGSDDSTTPASVTVSRTSSSSLKNRAGHPRKTRSHNLPARSSDSQPRLSSLPQRHQHIHNKLRQDNHHPHQHHHHPPQPPPPPLPPHSSSSHNDRIRSQKLKEERQALLHQMKELLSKANTDNEKLKDELVAKENHLQFLNQELERTKTDQSELMEETYDLYREAEKSLAKLKERLKGKEAELDQANGKLDDIRHAHQRLVAEKETAEKSADDKDALYQGMMRDRQQEIHSLKGLLETQQEERAKLQRVAEELKEEISVKEKSQEQLSQAIATKGEELAKAREDIDTLTQFLQTAAAKESVARGKLEAFVTELIDRADRAERELNHLRGLEISSSSGNVTADPLVVSGGYPSRNVKNVNAAMGGRNQAVAGHRSAKTPHHGRHPRASRADPDSALPTHLDPWYNDLGMTTSPTAAPAPVASSAPVQPIGSGIMPAGVGTPGLSSFPQSVSPQQLPGHVAGTYSPQAHGQSLPGLQQQQLQQMQQGLGQSLPSQYLGQPASLQPGLQAGPLQGHQAPAQFVPAVNAQHAQPPQGLQALPQQQQTQHMLPQQMQQMVPPGMQQAIPHQMQQMVPQQTLSQSLPHQAQGQMVPQPGLGQQGQLSVAQHPQQTPQQQSPQFLPQPAGQSIPQGLELPPSGQVLHSGGSQDPRSTSVGLAPGPSTHQQSLPQAVMLPAQQYEQQQQHQQQPQQPQGPHPQASSTPGPQRSVAASPQPAARSQRPQQSSPAGPNLPQCGPPAAQSSVSQSGAHPGPNMARRNTNPFVETYTLQPAPSLSVSELSEDFASLPVDTAPQRARPRNRENPHAALSFQPPLSPLGSEREESSSYADLPRNGGRPGRIDSNPFRSHLSSSMLSRQPAAYDDAEDQGGSDRRDGHSREGVSANSHNFLVNSSGKVIHKDRFSSVSSNPFKEEMNRCVSPASAYKSNMYQDVWKEGKPGGQHGGVNGKAISPDRTYPIYCITGREARDHPWEDISDSNGSYQDTPHFNMAVVHRKPRAHRGKGHMKSLSSHLNNQHPPKKPYRYCDDSSTDGLELSVDENGILWEAAADSMSEASESYRISPYGSETAGDVDTSVLMSSHHTGHQLVHHGGQDTDNDVDSLDEEGVLHVPKDDAMLRISDEGILRSDDEVLRASEEKALRRSEEAMLRLSEEDLKRNPRRTSPKRENRHVPLDERINRVLKTVDRDEDSEPLDLLINRKENSFPRHHLMDRNASVYGTYRRAPQAKADSPLERALAVQNRVKSLTYPRSSKKSVTISEELASKPKAVPAERKSDPKSGAVQQTGTEPNRGNRFMASPLKEESSQGSTGGMPRSTESSHRSAEDSLRSSESLHRLQAGCSGPVAGPERSTEGLMQPTRDALKSAESSRNLDYLEDFSSSTYASLPSPQRTKGEAGTAVNRPAEGSNSVPKAALQGTQAGARSDLKSAPALSLNSDGLNRASNSGIPDDFVNCEVSAERPQADGGMENGEQAHSSDQDGKREEPAKKGENITEQASSGAHPSHPNVLPSPSPEPGAKSKPKTPKLSSIKTQPSSTTPLTRQHSVAVEEAELQQLDPAPSTQPSQDLQGRSSPLHSVSSVLSSESESVCVSPPLPLPPPQPREKGDDDSTDFDLESDLEKFTPLEGGVKRGVVTGRMGSKKSLRKLKGRKVGGRKQSAHLTAPDTPEDSSSNVSDAETTSKSQRREAARRRRVALFHIFSHLDTRSLCKVSLVCKEWKRVSRHPSLWKHVYLKYDQISSKFLVTLAQWCTQVTTLTLEGLRAGSRKPSETLDEYQRRTRGCLEAGLEELLKASQDSLTSLSIVACGNLLTEKCMWLVSGYCRLMQRLTYLSDCHPITAEVMWALGGGCPSITSLVIPPLFPCHGSEGMTNRCLMLIAQFYPDLLEVGVGGRTIDLTGLVPLVQSCQRLTSLCMDHVKELGEDTVTALCRAGLRQLGQLELSGTPVTAKAIKTFYSSCRHLTEIRVFVCINDYFEDVRKKKNKEEYKKIAKSLEELKSQAGLGNVLQIRAAPIE